MPSYEVEVEVTQPTVTYAVHTTGPGVTGPQGIQGPPGPPGPPGPQPQWWKGTLAEYQALGTYDADTLYVITG